VVHGCFCREIRTLLVQPEPTAVFLGSFNRYCWKYVCAALDAWMEISSGWVHSQYKPMLCEEITPPRIILVSFEDAPLVNAPPRHPQSWHFWQIALGWSVFFKEITEIAPVPLRIPPGGCFVGAPLGAMWDGMYWSSEWRKYRRAAAASCCCCCCCRRGCHPAVHVTSCHSRLSFSSVVGCWKRLTRKRLGPSWSAAVCDKKQLVARGRFAPWYFFFRTPLLHLWKHSRASF